MNDATCPHNDRGDMNCDGYDDMLDVAVMVDWLFAGSDPPWDPCLCDSYPADCP